ncbi:hypothetical protein NDU88_007256 [Pleurodeles waltl]|uniref:Protein FAM111A n=2 Tax=Pleurodeles waltl TaxID=8319 RepID=A0AAV7SS80_PLEWA|nr:hypothetical protein NDU88_007256 [Pleurodeles waltl]
MVGGKRNDHGKSESTKVDAGEDKEIEFKLSLDGNNGTHIVRGKADCSIYSALVSLDTVEKQKANNKKKELHLLDKQGPCGYVNLGMPLKCLEEGSKQFDMRFYPFNKKGASDVDDNFLREKYRAYDGGANEYVTFYVSAKGTKKSRILLSNVLHKSKYSICVFAAKGETFRDALCKDGRFLPLLAESTAWKMRVGKDAYDSECVVDTYAKKTFEVEICNLTQKKVAHATTDQTCEQLRSLTEHMLQAFPQSLLQHYPSLAEQGNLIKEAIEEEAKTQDKTPRVLLELEKEEFSKRTVNSTPVTVHKMLGNRSRSVGYITWNNNGNRGSASCFVLGGGYILTCHHVIRDIVGEGVPEGEWPKIIHDSTKVSFTYEENPYKKRGLYSIEPWLGPSDKGLDYALLEMKKSKRAFPPGLMPHVSRPPHNGLVYIIGHPDGEVKATDACTVIAFLERHQEIRRRLEEGRQQGDSHPNCDTEGGRIFCIHMFTKENFREIRSSRTVTYDTSFFQGSSGSPVFDSSGRLVAMHAAGYRYNLKRRKLSVIEFGWLMEEIRSDIKKKDRVVYKSLKNEAVRNDEQNRNVTCNGDDSMDIDSEGMCVEETRERSNSTSNLGGHCRKRKHMRN